MTNNNNVKTPFKRFLNIGMAEGVSFIVLLFIAMPLKYMANMPEAVKIVGMIHGVLFIMYAVVLVYVTNFYGWKIKIAIIAFLLSFLPFGTFLLKKLTKDAV
jgi:integral membrane protein